jgi:FlaG/FlaF family flagellin (archaellin)
MPTVDISASNISKVSLYIDVLHNRADNFQDRLEFVARAGNDATTLGDYVRESGTPLFKDGSITGADTGIEVGGAYAAGAFEDITVTSPIDSGLEVTGQTAATVDGLEVDGGTYGVLIGTSASGSIELANLDLDSQTSAGVYYTKDISGGVAGTVTNSGGAAFKYGTNTDNPVTMSSMSIASNAVGIETAGTAEFTLTDVTMNNAQDVVISGSSQVEFIEGTIDVDSVDVTGQGMFTRMRTLDVTLTADSSPVADATVTLLDASGGAAGAAITDASGVANDLTFVTATVDISGKTIPSLVGYTALTVAEVDYSYTSSSVNVADFRYADAGVTLTDASGNAESIALTQKISHRVCWYSSSTAYTTVAPCAGSFSTSGSRTLSDGDGGTVSEYGYYGGISTSLTNEVVMMDSPYLYLNGGTDYDFNGTTMLVTGVYDYLGNARFYSKSPGGSGFYMDDGGVYGVAVDEDTGNAYGVELGYYFYNYANFVVNNSVLSNIATIDIANGYRSLYGGNYNWEVETLSVTNSTISHYKGYTSLNNAIQVTDICMQVSGGDGGVISGNTFNNCGVGVMLERANYYTYHNGVVGADNITISDNTFNDGGEIADVWFYTNGDADNAIVSGNTFNSGDTSNGAIAMYPGNHEGTVISDNTINTLANGIYVRSAIDFSLEGNTINGAGDAAHAGIDISGGYGDVTNNTLVDADGGIVLDSMTNPPAPSTSLCTIRSFSYNSGPVTCAVTLAPGKTMAVNIATDSWGYEASITIDKPDGSTDTWSTNTFASNTAYEPLVSYSDAGNYTLNLRDSYGDGGTDVFMVEGGTAGGYTGPVVADNSIELSASRVSPNAVGLLMEDCDGVQINSARNSVTLSDAAMVISNCDVVDVGSTLLGDGTASTSGIDADDLNGDTLTLSGTTVSGYENGVTKTSGALYLTGDASLTGSSYGAYVDDATVSAITANVDGGATGTGLYVIDSDDVWVYPMNASGLVGMYVENTPFRWDGGTVDATTALEVVESQGTVENMTWTASTNQINAGTNAYVTSIGNSIDASKLIVDSSATIDEANLFSMTSTHLTATPTKEVSMLIQSTDGTRASYVSTSFQPEVMNVDGSMADWNGGNDLNPSGYAMPGIMSGDGTNDLAVTYIEGDDLYFGLTGVDLSTSDLLIYLSVDGAGSSTGYNLGGAHNLPFQANYLLWADSETSYDLYSYGFLGWGPTSLSSAAVDIDFSGDFAEISIPFSRMGGTPDQVDIVAIVQGENTADVSTVHPTQTIDAANTIQSFTEYMTVELTHDDLTTGAISDEVLVYRSYKGSNTPSIAKNYDVMIKTEADCAYDWATTEDVSLATNVNLNMDMARACPEIQASLADVTVDEDSGAYTFSLTNMADDVQDEEASLTWVSTSGNIVAYDNVLVDWAQNGHSVTITPMDDQFGTMDYEFTVTDSNGLTDTKNISFEVLNVNDAPVICNVLETDCMPMFSEDGNFTNILAEGFGVHSKFLGNVSNASKSYIRDMANEQSPDRQVYDWDASIPADCIAFSVEVNALNELVITENTNNELGGTCTVTLTLADDAALNSDATPYDVAFSVSPVNDAPVIPTWDRQNGTVMEAGNGSIPAAPWQISLMEDDTSTENLTYDLSAVMTDVDHNLSDLTWTVVSTNQCTYTNYFTTTIVGDQLVFTLIPDATTNAKDWEIDYLNDNGIHQIGPSGSEFCKIRLVLEDTATAPSYVPNYDTTLMPIADYQQGQDDIEIGVRVENVREQVADYYLDSVGGFDFNGVTNIMTGTYVPVTVEVGAGGDEGPFTYDHMLAVTFHTDGHTEDEQTRYYTVPSYGTTVEFDEMVYITKDTTNVWVEMDVVTCLTDPCDLTAAVSDRFQTDDPASHRANNNGIQGADWSKPGQYGSNATQTSERRPLLEDSNWCNNRMTSLETGSICNHANQPPGTFEATGQPLPTVVRTIGASSVPSFAPSIVAVSLTGLFVSALAFSSRRADDEEEVVEKTMVDDDVAVSPVIATILMVAITVVLSGVIYVWASSLAETDVKGVPRITFDIEDIDGADAETGHWRITVQSSETDLATQAVVLRVIYTDGDGNTAIDEANMADTSGVYGFNPDNSDSFITFVDQVNKEGTDSVSTFNTGDTIFVRTHAPDGTPLEEVTIQLSYAPSVGQGAVLRTWSGLSYDVKA